MRIKLIHPTRGRKQIALATSHKWLTNADHPKNITYVFSVDADDTDDWQNINVRIENYDLMFAPVWAVIRNENKSAIQAINIAAQFLNDTTEQYENYLLIVVSDDFDCLPGWDTSLTIMTYNRNNFLAKTKDCLQPTLVTLPILDRIYYNNFGYVYHPGYLHMFCDQEMTAVAHMTGKIIDLPILFEHLHYSTGKFQKDAISLKNDSSWQQGETLFNERLKTNFGLSHEQIVKPYNQIQWK